MHIIVFKLVTHSHICCFACGHRIFIDALLLAQKTNLHAPCLFSSSAVEQEGGTGPFFTVALCLYPHIPYTGMVRSMYDSDFTVAVQFRP